MADPRYKNGIHKNGAACGDLSRAATRAPILDSPTAHGWQVCGRSPSTGYTLYALRLRREPSDRDHSAERDPAALTGAQMRCATPRERFMTGHEYVIAIGGRVYTAPGDLARITAEVRALLAASRSAELAASLRAELLAQSNETKENDR